MLKPGPAVAPLDARLSARLAGFAGFLRANGFAIGGGDATDVVRAARAAGVLDRDVLRWNLKALLCGRSEEWRRYDALFDAWPNRWQAPQRRAVDDVRRDGLDADAGVEPAGGDSPPRDDDARPRRAASARHRDGTADFRDLAAREHAVDVEMLMRRFARQVKRIRLRRDSMAPRGRRLALPTTIRRSIASGGTPLRLAWTDRRRVQPRLVWLIDVSRSMAPYSFFHLRLARALAAERSDVHSFIFHTRVTAVSQALHDPDPWRAQERLHLVAQGWAGGTRIGDSLAEFNRAHAPRLVHRRTAVIIVSDGYDTGDPARLAAALQQLRRRARRIAWINPLAGRPGWEPTCLGMQAALPHLDVLAAGADLASIRAALPRLIEGLR